MAPISLCRSLRTLQLTGNATIGDAGLRALAEACGAAGGGLPLADLRLGGNSIGDEGVRALAESCFAVGGT